MIEVVTGMVVLGLVVATLALAGYIVLRKRHPGFDAVPLCYCQHCGRCRHQVLMNQTRSRYLGVECCDELIHED